MTTIQIKTGTFYGRYEIAANGKIQQVQFSHRGEIRRTVGRGTARHRAVLAAIAGAE